MAVIEPVRGRKERPIPAYGLLLVNPTEARSCSNRLLAAGGRRQYLFNSELVIDKKKDFFIAGPAVGAPAAVMALEKLVALGARQLILCGWCGAISADLAIGDIIVPDSARIGEGTSQYYNRQTESAPSVEFSCRLRQLLTQNGLPVSGGKVWSTDGIFREERQELLALHRQHNVIAVDMEFSALCSAAALREIAFAASLVVSDLVAAERWQPGFTKERFRNNRERVLDILFGRAARIEE